MLRRKYHFIEFQFDEMATRLGEIPEKTKELVELQRYLKTSMTDTMPVLTSKIEVRITKYIFCHMGLDNCYKSFNCDLRVTNLLSIYLSTYLLNASDSITSSEITT